jgi:hypothetical protein
MKRIMTLLQNVLLRQILTVFLVGLISFTIQALSYDRGLQVQAQVMTPEEYSERVNILNRERFGKEIEPLEKAKTSLKETADNVKEKLNLDEPVPQSTKDFFSSVQKKVEETVEPLIGSEPGYYQDSVTAK